MLYWQRMSTKSKEVAYALRTQKVDILHLKSTDAKFNGEEFLLSKLT